MELTSQEKAMLEGEFGSATRKAMEILAALGKIYGAERLLPVSSVQISGVSYDNLGDAGLEFLAEMAGGGGRARVLTTLNPAGMDIENPGGLGIPEDFARKQRQVIDAFAKMNVVTTCTCTPYLVGNLPHFGEHIAWSESSAVAYANAVLGARTNREGGPSALAASLTGRTPAYGLHLDENRRPGVAFEVQATIKGTDRFGLLGMAAGRMLEKLPGKPVVYFSKIPTATVEELKSFCASFATYGGAGLFHIEGITPEAAQFSPPLQKVQITENDLLDARNSLGILEEPVDFVTLGCPHLSLNEIARLAELLDRRKVKKEFWVTTSRPVKQTADRMGYSTIIEESGAKFATDTCCVVAPIAGRFKHMVTDSAKACYYGAAKNRFKVSIRSFEDVVKEALS